MADQNRRSGHFLSCDWGTSTFRLKHAETETGDIHASVHSPTGIQQIFNRWTTVKESVDRLSYYLAFLKDEIDRLSNKIDKELSGIPVIISGMASSSIGIRELPYTSLPLSLGNPVFESLWIDEEEGFPHDILLLSGVCGNDDIMRGEETQLVGLADLYNIENSVCILPGTHSKHVYIQNNQLVHFDTFMSGELFHLLSADSILKNSVSRPEAGLHDTAFLKGVEVSQNGALLKELFKIRSKELLRKTSKEENFDYLSGLIIGSELNVLTDIPADQVFLLGGGDLQPYYSTALNFLEINHQAVPETDNLVVLGQRLMLKKIQT